VLHTLRKQKQWLGLTLVPLLLMVWLSLTCQNCFAAKADVSAACDHQVQMECCPSGHMHDQSDNGSCDASHMVTQAVVIDTATFKTTDHVFPDMASVDVVGFPKPLPLAYRLSRVKVVHSPHSIFKHYRILLI